METKGCLSAAFFSANRKRLREVFGGTAPIVIAGNGLLQKSADAVYPFTQDSNFWYLTGISEPNLLLVLDGGKEYIITPQEDATRTIFDGKSDTVVLSKISGIETWLEYNAGWDRLSRRLKKVKHLATLQPASHFIDSLGMYTNPARAALIAKVEAINSDLDLIDLRSQLSSMRAVKQPEELQQIKQAVSQTVKMFQVVGKKLPRANSEHELMTELEKWRVSHSAEYAYDPIIASGSNALTLHYHANDARYRQDSFLLLDIGARTGGYCADVTRTVVQKPTKRQKAVYDAVLSVHTFACSLLKPGTSLATYEQAVMQYMGEKLRELGLIRTIHKESIRGYYPHATSHFIGIDTHDVGDHEMPLSAGMVLSVEPGIYIADENIAVRLEDMIVITENGNENLTSQIIKKVDTL